MKVTRNKIIEAIHKVWPHLTWKWNGPSNIYIARYEYHAPTIEQFKKFMEWDWTNELPYNIDFFACSNFSQLLSIKIDLYLFHLIDKGKLKQEEVLEWTLMEAWGTMFRGQYGGHAVNLLLDAENKLWLTEPQKNWDVWEPDPNRDKVIFIKL